MILETSRDRPAERPFGLFRMMMSGAPAIGTLLIVLPLSLPLSCAEPIRSLPDEGSGLATTRTGNDADRDHEVLEVVLIEWDATRWKVKWRRIAYFA